MERDALGLQTGVEIGKCGLDRVGDFKCVCTILLVDVHHDAGLSHDRRRANRRFGRFDHVCDVAERNAAAIGQRHDCAGDIFGVERPRYPSAR